MIITGTNASETLDGVNDYLAGHASVDLNDTIYGLGGDDLIRAYNAGLYSLDTLYGGTGNDSLYGYDGNDTLYGEDGNDVLDGGTQTDIMRGGKGDDIYYINNYDDQVIEAVNEGYDWVGSPLDIIISAFYNVEGLALIGSAKNGTGNTLDNSILGNSLNNTLNGVGGNDNIRGEGGNDTLIGGLGNDVLNGGSGSDTLSGSSGADYFVFQSVSDSPASSGRDKITDFSGAAGDKIDVSLIDADLTQPGNQAFTQGTYVSGILTGDVIGGADIQIELVGAPALNFALDVIL